MQQACSLQELTSTTSSPSFLDLPNAMSANGTSGRLPFRFTPTGISVLIVGGGVAGLLAALECWRKGHEVRIVERSPSRVQSGKPSPYGGAGQAVNLEPVSTC